MLRTVATVDEQHRCPLYRTGDALEFTGTVVQGASHVPVCATAVENLNRIARRSQDGMDPATFGRTFCGGCTGRAWFTLSAVKMADPLPTPAGPPGVTVADLKNVQILAGVPEGQLQRILPLMREQFFPEGMEIRRRGEPAGGLHLILNGECEVVTSDDNVLWTLRAGECLGVISLISGEPSAANVRAKTDVRLLTVPKDEFPRLLASVPTLVLALARVLAARLARASGWVVDELKRGILGKLEIIAPVEIVQAMHVNGLTGILVAQNGAKTVTISFQEGQVREVESGDLQGEEAFYEFLTWKRGKFRFEPIRRIAPINPIQQDTFTLLLEGMRRSDETKRRTR